MTAPSRTTWWRAALAGLAVAAAAGLASCGPRPVAPSDISATALATHLSRLTAEIAPEDSVAAARRARYAADRLREAGVQPALYGSFLIEHRRPATTPTAEVDPARAHVMGYVAGRNPRFASKLVLLTADLNSTGAAAVLEASRGLVGEGLQAIVPEATVGIALWAPPHTGAAGVRDFLARPPWSIEGVSRVLHVTRDTTDLAATRGEWESAGIPFEIVFTAEIWPAQEAQGDEARRLAAVYRLAHAALRTVRIAASADRVRVSEQRLVL